MQVKICGMRYADNIQKVAALAPDFMGFIFYPPSPRYCENFPEYTVRNLPDSILSVAVMVDMDYDAIMGLVKRYGLRGAQLHGNESPELCRKLKSSGLFVIKAISVKDDESLSKVNAFSDSVDLIVLDTATKSKGGSGKKFDWDLLNNADIKIDYLLSGGIGPDDAKEVSALKHPHMIGVDLNSRFEISPGVKSVSQLKNFMEEINR